MKLLFARLVQGPHAAAENFSGGLSLLLAIVLLLVGFTHSLDRPVRLNAYTQRGNFSYSAPVVHPPSAAYPSGEARTGDPLYLSAVRLARFDFSYRFASRFGHKVHGTIELAAVLSADSTLRNSYVLTKPHAFSGNEASIGGVFDLMQLKSLVAQLSLETGASGAQYSISLEPIVHVTGTVGGTEIDTRFAPTLPFTATQTSLELDVPQPAILPGATYTPPSADSALQAALRPAGTGQIPGVASRNVSLARYSFPISTIRGLGLGLLGLALIIFLSKLFKPTREVWPRERRIAARHGCVVVDVLSVGDLSTATEVPDFENLAILAQYCERPILREGSEGSYVHTVDDDGRLYVHRPAQQAAVAPVVPAPPVQHSTTPHKRRRLVTRVLGAVFVLAVVGTLATSFTATNVVPLSHAGTVSPALSVALGAPVQCASVGVTNLVVASSSSVTGTSGNDLILGEKGTGTRTLNGGAGNDCIVAGGLSGTTNTLDGGTGSNNVCIGAPGARNNFTNCNVTVN
jgi:hypothetical protein